MDEENKKIYEIFRLWFTRRWLAWENEQGRQTTQQELADYLNITRSSVAQYVSGKVLPSGKNLRHIAEKWPDVYKAVDDQMFQLFPEPLATKLRQAASEIEEMQNRDGFEVNSPEHKRVARELFAKYGLDLYDIDISED